YPVETIPVEDRGRMHQVGPGYYFFQNLPDTSLYRTTDLKSYHGNSGGPLCVQSQDSLGRTFFLPAGIYLGGSGESIVHAIDLDVVDVINQAELASHGGGNSTGGGPITITTGQLGLGSFPFMRVNFSGPSGVVWQLVGDNSNDYITVSGYNRA